MEIIKENKQKEKINKKEDKGQKTLLQYHRLWAAIDIPDTEVRDNKTFVLDAAVNYITYTNLKKHRFKTLKEVTRTWNQNWSKSLLQPLIVLMIRIVHVN